MLYGSIEQNKLKKINKCRTGSFSRALKFPIPCLPYLMDHQFDRRLRKKPQKALKPTKRTIIIIIIIIIIQAFLLLPEAGTLSIEARAEIFLFATASTDCWAHRASYVTDKRRSLLRSYSGCSAMLTIHLHLMLKVKNDWRHTNKTRAILGYGANAHTLLLLLFVLVLIVYNIITTTITLIITGVVCNRLVC
jgi:hypothetical protein